MIKQLEKNEFLIDLSYLRKKERKIVRERMDYKKEESFIREYLESVEKMQFWEQYCLGEKTIDNRGEFYYHSYTKILMKKSLFSPKLKITFLEDTPKRKIFNLNGLENALISGIIPKKDDFEEMQGVHGDSF